MSKQIISWDAYISALKFVEEAQIELNVIDLDKADWDAIKQAAAESSWIPHFYYQNDWVSDVCNYLRNGTEPLWIYE